MQDKGNVVSIHITCDDGGQYDGFLKSEDPDGTYSGKDFPVIYPNPTHCHYQVDVITYTGGSGGYQQRFFYGEFDVVAP